MEVTYVCVVCAETLVSLKWVSDMYPIPGVECVVKWNGSRSIKVRVGKHVYDYEIPRNAYGIVEYGGMRILATSEGTGRPLKFKVAGEEGEEFSDNVFSLWSKIRKRFENPLENENEKIDLIEKKIRKTRKQDWIDQ